MAVTIINKPKVKNFDKEYPIWQQPDLLGFPYFEEDNQNQITNRLLTIENFEQFLDDNSKNSIFQQSTYNISSDDLTKRVNNILNKKNLIKNSEFISYNQIDITKGSFPEHSRVSQTGLYSDLNYLPQYDPENEENNRLYNFHKIAFTGDYRDLKNTPILEEEHEIIFDYDEIKKKLNLSNFASTGLYSDLEIDSLPNQDNLYNFHKIAFTSNFNDLENTPAIKTSNEVIKLVDNHINNALEDFILQQKPFIYKFDFLNIMNNNLKLLSENKFNTNEFLYNNNDTTLEIFLNNIINLYFIDNNYEEKQNNIINFITYYGNMILLNLKKVDNIFLFYFSHLNLNNSFSLQTQEDIQNIIPNYFYPSFIFIPEKHELWIRNIHSLLVSQLKTIAFTSNYEDLESDSKPKTKNIAESGMYSDLIEKPTLENINEEFNNFNRIAFTGNYSDLLERPNKNNLVNEFKEIAFTSDYLDLSNRPSKINLIDGFKEITFTGDYNNLENNTPSEEHSYNFSDLAFNNNYYKLSNRPNRNNLIDFKQLTFTGSYNDLNDKPALNYRQNFSKIAFTGDFNDFNDLTSELKLHNIAYSGDYNYLENKPTIIKASDIIKVFDVSNFTSPKIREFKSGVISTTGAAISNSTNNQSVQGWLDDIILAYYDAGEAQWPTGYNKEKLNIIKLTNHNQTLVLTNIKQNNEIFIFSFLPIYNYIDKNLFFENIQELINKNEEYTNEDIENTFSNIMIYFVFDRLNEKLYIYTK